MESENNNNEKDKNAKKARNVALNIPGTKPNIQNAQLLISTGIPSLDHIMGGGLAVGTIILIEDDVFGTYGPVIQKYFLAEGAINGHSLYVASKDIDPRKIIDQLPELAEKELQDEGKKSESDSEKMIIAWRYQHLPTQEGKKDLPFGHHYDLSKTMNKDILNKLNIHYWDNNSVKNDRQAPNTFTNPEYHHLLQDIKDYIKYNKFDVDSTPEKRNVLRIVLHEIGSAYWLPVSSDAILPSDVDKDIDIFLFCLKAILRSAFAVAMITIPKGAIEKNYIERCIHVSDAAINLESFVGTPNEKNPALSNYDGFLKITKLPTINTIEPPQSTDLDLAFKLYRKKFSIEKLHLPPEMEESKQREQDEGPRISCSSFGNLKLDF